MQFRLNNNGNPLPSIREPTDDFSFHIKDSKACIIVVHEVWGVDLHIKRVCKRLSKLGFSTAAPDLYSRNKRLFTSENIRQAIINLWHLPLKERYDQKKVMQILEQKHASRKIIELTTTLYNKRFRESMLQDLTSCAEYIASRYKKAGVVGFSMGGGLSFKLAARFPKLESCISFCGEPPETQELQKITTPILAIYAGQDEFMNSRVPEFVGDTLKQNKDLTLKIYPHAKHEFFNEMNKNDYNREAATDSWKIAEDFLIRTMT